MNIKNHECTTISFIRENNIFSILNIRETENVHSYFLGWLLDPRKNHNLGDTFFKTLLRKVNDKSFDPDCDYSDLEINIDSGIENPNTDVRPDILIKSPKSKLVVCIENKINSREGKGQLDNYYKYVSEDYCNYKKIFIYLTKNNDKSSNSNWHDLAYEELLEVLDSITNENKKILNEYVLFYIQCYRYTVKDIITKKHGPFFKGMDEYLNSNPIKNNERKSYVSGNYYIPFILKNSPKIDITLSFDEHYPNEGYRKDYINCEICFAPKKRATDIYHKLCSGREEINQKAKDLGVNDSLKWRYDKSKDIDKSKLYPAIGYSVYKPVVIDDDWDNHYTWYREKIKDLLVVWEEILAPLVTKFS